MKKILLTTLSLAAGVGAFAQLPVSQTTEDRHAILEEFTGIHCGYCPDGHAIGNTLTANNPGTFHKIHIHAGGYATPGAGEPDLRTTAGTAIDNAAAPSGYPAGGINRGTSGGWSMGRGSWTSSANTVMGQTSYVNVAVEGSVDPGTRLLTVDAEIFYTGTAPTGTQYLSIALTQSGIGGPQTDYGNYNPSGWKCPQKIYKHAHVLRMLVNTGGTSGDAISTTTGAVVSKQYQVTLPAAIAGVDLELGELELVGFITEGNNLTSTIVSGNEGPVDVVLGAVTPADLSASANHIAPTGLCDNQFTPKMNVTNNSGSSITGIDVTYYVNGVPTTESLPTQVITAGGTYTHTFTQGTLAAGSNSIDYEVTLTDVTKTDLSILNNTGCVETINVIPPTAFGTSITEGFESMAVGDDSPMNAIFSNPDDNSDYVVSSAVSSSVTWDLGAYENSTKSFRFYYYNDPAGTKSAIIYEKVDLSTTSGYQLSFDHAYKQYSNENDRLQIFVSTNCGTTWTSIFNKSGSALSTGAAQTATFYPKSGDWTNNIVNLASYESVTELMFKFEGTSAYGNNLYIDNINVENNVGIIEEEVENSLSIYPNPTKDYSIVSFNLTEPSLVTMNVYNTMGSLVFARGQENLGSGLQKITFNGTELPSGIYFVNLTVGDKLITKKISLLK